MMMSSLDEFKEGNLITMHVGDVASGQDQRDCLVPSQTGRLHLPRSTGKRASKSKPLYSVHPWDSFKCPDSRRCPHFRGVLIEGIHYIYSILLLVTYLEITAV